MSNNWEFYHCKVDSKPAYIFFDVKVSNEIEVKNYPFMAYVRIYLIMPNQDGLSANEEYDKLCEIEDALERGLATDNAAYVGRNTSDGCRDFYYYTSSSRNWTELVDRIMASFPEYEYECDSREDSAWSTYFDFLYPSPRDWETIKSRNVCDRLHEQGDSMDTVREIDHWIYFENVLNREAFNTKARNLGYKLRSKIEPDEDSKVYGIQVYHESVPSPYVSLELYDISLECNGDYDGWETPVIT